MAIATLLRLADAALGDAALLADAGNRDNARFLGGHAVRCMLDAVVASEAGWRPETPGVLGAVPDENPIKAALVAVHRHLPPSPLPMPSGDGSLPEDGEGDEFDGGLRLAETLLEQLVAGFQVDLSGDGAARATAKLRPAPPAPEPTPAAERRKLPLREPGEPVQELARPRTRVVVDARTEPRTDPAVEPHEVAGRSALEPRKRPETLASTTFWSLMDRWQVGDVEALALIGHAGGLTKKGTRPRFKLAGGEVDMLLGLQEMAAAMALLQLDAAGWLHKPLKDRPFVGATPLAFLTRARLGGIRDAIRFLARSGLKMSVSP